MIRRMTSAMLVRLTRHSPSPNHFTGNARSPMRRETLTLTAASVLDCVHSRHMSPMAQKIYIGKRSEFVGKYAFEILANLKNFGVGRVLQRNLYKKEYPEPCYFKITQVAPQMDENLMFGRVWGIEVFRGKKYPYIRETSTDRPDYSLLRVHEEPDFNQFPVLGEATDHLITVPSKIPAPPVMAEFFNRSASGVKPLYLDAAVKDENNRRIHLYSMNARYPKQGTEEFDFWYKVEEEKR